MGQDDVLVLHQLLGRVGREGMRDTPWPIKA